MDVADILRLIADRETDRVERKASLANVNRVREASRVRQFGFSGVTHTRLTGTTFTRPGIVEPSTSPPVQYRGRAMIRVSSWLRVVTREETNFGQPGITDYRNPTIAGSLGQLGFVQRFGVGLRGPDCGRTATCRSSISPRQPSSPSLPGCCGDPRHRRHGRRRRALTMSAGR